ncbi:SRPBCC domain-containing protein [Flavobacterium sp. HSC-61S13]|uniref:SRPBCC family protein n=1 Tax=Flavobacterium sp. HSC-61S13 TaxID=2910963 RepID=UPI00209CA373|nr:SRPBCC family protein [Flavobacterium sp. HSC-61S13]MCP1996402.1 uncharacterized protein YndB with AHSA1/START domain [Flavobacterium sp. HSC-61S13]
MVTSEMIIKAPTSVIWQALTDRDQMREWYFDIADFKLELGETFNFYEPGEARQYHHQCIIKGIEPNQKFSHTWTHPSHSKGESLLTWTLEDLGDATKVSLQHQGLENFADAGPGFEPENYQKGWDGYMAILKNFVYGIRKQTFTIEINATAEKVWQVLFNDQTYRAWTGAFCQGSYYTGALKPASRIHFLSATGSGMFSDVIFCTPNQSVYFQHLGELKDFKELPIDEATEKWSGSFENYILTEQGGKTTLQVEIDLTADHIDYFKEAFPKGLNTVKELAEK